MEMLITAQELVNSIKDISVLQLAYLVKVEAISRPITFLSEPQEFLFDSGHQREILDLLGYSSSELRQHDLREPIGESDTPAAPYSEEARHLLEKPHVATHLPDRAMEQFFQQFLGEPTPSWYRRAWRYLTRLRLGVTLTGDEQTAIAVHQGIGVAKLNSWLVLTVAPRLRRFDAASAFDRCLQTYVNNYEYVGWTRFIDELAILEMFLKEDPGLRGFPIRQGLERIREIEKAYRNLESQSADYLAKVDPEKLIAMRLFQEKVVPKLLEIIRKAEDRAKRSIQDVLPGKKELNELLTKPIERYMRS
jgi:hypothetical protein